MAQRKWEQPGERHHTCHTWSGTERGVAAENFIAAQAGERDFEAGLTRRPGYEIRVYAIDARLIESGNGIIEMQLHFIAAQKQLGMLGS